MSKERFAFCFYMANIVNNMKKVIVLDNIRSVYNVGSIFRTADALLIDKIFLCGTTPTPTDRFGRVRKDLAKVALGAEKNIAWQYFKNTTDVLKKLKKEKFQIIAIEQAKSSVDYKKVKTKNNVAIVVGNEVEGINKKILSLCDIIAEIPMSGKKESLNVSVAFGVVAFRILEK
jgi:23S rRNA (guanosine2251-2'-O)-methyltransferase